MPFNEIRSEKVREAFKYIDRSDFVSEKEKESAYEDIPLSIGYGQTISQPLVVAFMLEALDPREGDKVLDVGFGSGWTTALLAFIIGSEGKVIAVEKIPEVYEFGKKNIEKYNFLRSGRVEVFCGDGKEGKKEEAPFDRILVSASAKDDLPSPLKEQLKVGGKAVVPIGSSVFLFSKEEKGFQKTEYPGFLFVPLV